MMARSLLALSLVMSPLALVRGFMPAATAPLARLRAPGMRAQAASIRMMADGKAEVGLPVLRVGVFACEHWGVGRCVFASRRPGCI